VRRTWQASGSTIVEVGCCSVPRRCMTLDGRVGNGRGMTKHVYTGQGLRQGFEVKESRNKTLHQSARVLATGTAVGDHHGTASPAKRAKKQKPIASAIGAAWRSGDTEEHVAGITGPRSP